MDFSDIKHKSVAVVAIGLMMLLVSASGAYAAAGIVVAASGKVTVHTGGETVAAAMGTALEPGDVVSSAGGTASILMADGRILQVAAGQSVTVAADNAGDDKGAAERLISTLSDTVRASASPRIKGMVRGEGDLTAVYPFNSAVTRQNLMFRWKMKEEMADLEIEIKSMSPKYRYKFRTASNAMETRLPEHHEPLETDTKYYWKVSGKTAGGEGKSGSALMWFAVLGEDTVQKLSRDIALLTEKKIADPDIRTLLLASIYASYELYHESAQVLLAQIDRSKSPEGLKQMLKGVYAKMGIGR